MRRFFLSAIVAPALQPPYWPSSPSSATFTHRRHVPFCHPLSSLLYFKIVYLCLLSSMQLIFHPPTSLFSLKGPKLKPPSHRKYCSASSQFRSLFNVNSINHFFPSKFFNGLLFGEITHNSTQLFRFK